MPASVYDFVEPTKLPDRTTLSSDKRGLVISPPVKTDGNSFSFNSSLDLQDLRANLLFWDEFDLPSTNLISFLPEPDVNFLMEAGIISRTTLFLANAGTFGESYVVAHKEVFRRRDLLEPGIWSLGRGKHSVAFNSDEIEYGRGVLIKLHQAIPVPVKEVPLHDILEFREKRRSELLSLRHHLEDVYQKVISSSDGQMALQTEISKLDQAISNQLKISREAGFLFRKMTLDIGLNLFGGVMGAATSYVINLNKTSALLTGAVAAISIGPSYTIRNREPTRMPFEYVTSYHDQLY